MKCKKNCLFLLIFPFLLGGINRTVNAQESMKTMQPQQYNYQTITDRSAQNISSWKENNSAAYYQHPEFGVLPTKAPKGNVVEDLSKRTENDRFFVDIDEPSVFYVQKGYFPLNYQDEHGNWRAIETALTSKGNNVYESKYYFEPAGFDFNKEQSYIKTRSGKINFNQWSLHKKVEEKVEFIAAPNWSDYTVGDDGVYITNIFDGIDAKMKVGKASIETDFIMNSNEYGSYEQLIFREHYKGDSPLSIVFSTDATKKEGVGDLDIKKNGVSILTMYEGVGFLADDLEERTTLAYVINDQQVDVVVPFSWIDNHIENSTLVIDPVVSGTETTLQVDLIGSMYSASCNFNNSCDYDMDVTFPPFATIINTTADFDYETKSSCLFNDGATRYLSGNCVSPPLTNYYWFCNTFNTGTCTGTDIPIYDDVKACFPGPACVAQDIPFQLQFYRGCKGASGCANDCIASASDWSVTVTGKTVDFNDNLSSSIDISATEICLGDTIVASTLGEYGVPPYTYNWSLFSTGTPTIGTSSSEDIVFTNAGSQYLYVEVIDDCNRTVKDSIEVIVQDTIVPEFPELGPYCMGIPDTLPTISDNGISGTWTPTLSTNTLGTTTYTFSAGGCTPDVVREITVLKSPYATISGDDEACVGDSILPEIVFTGKNTQNPYTFIYVINGDTMQVTTTADNDTSIITIPTDVSGIYEVELIQVLDSICSKVLNQSLTVNIYENPIPDFEASAYTAESETEIFFENTSSGEIAIEWYHYKDSSSFWGSDEDFSHLFTESGEHEVTLTAFNDHCESSITKTITILPREATYNLPNVFTPNGDGVNDLLNFDFNNVEELDFVILNRWGNIVFETNDYTVSWNGKTNNDGAECTDGTYFYKFSVTGLSGDEVEEHGFVHLHRD